MAIISRKGSELGHFTRSALGAYNFFGVTGDMVLISDTASGADDAVFYLTDEFTGVIQTSLAVDFASGAGLKGWGVSYDGTNTPFCNLSDLKLYLMSGQFTSFIKTSLSTSGVGGPTGISVEADLDTPWCARASKKFFVSSGQFTSTLKSSLVHISPFDQPDGISQDNNGDSLTTSWDGVSTADLVLYSGAFTSTVKASLDVSSTVTNRPRGISWDGTNTSVGWNKLVPADDLVHLSAEPSPAPLRIRLVRLYSET